MPRHVFVVSRTYPTLYGYLCERFEADENVAVILDRRRGDRRQRLRAALDMERRREERRRRQNLDFELQTQSHVIVTLD